MRFLPRRVGILALLALLLTPIFVFAQDDASLDVVGSSIVTPLLETVASEVDAALNVNVTGTDEGFRVFCAGEADLVAATRPISAEEDAACASLSVSYLELLVGHNIAAVIGSPENTFAQCLTGSELNAVFAPSAQGQNTNWNQINPSFNDTALTVYAPTRDTLAYALLDAVVEGVGIRSDVNALASADEIISAVSADAGAIGVVPLAAAQAAGESVKILDLNAGEAGCAAPSAESVESRTYSGGQRLFVYANSAETTASDFLNALVGEAGAAAVEAAGHVAPTANAAAMNSTILSETQTGRAFSADAIDYTIPSTVSGLVNVGGSASGAEYVNALTTAFSAQYPTVTVAPAYEGEPAGVRRLCNGEIDIALVTGELSQEQQDNCAANNITPTPVALGSQTVVLVANAASDYLTCLTTDQLATIWSAASTDTVTTWNQVDEAFPETEMTLFAPSTTSVFTDLLINQTVGANGVNRVDVELNADPLYRAAAVANVEGALTYMSWGEYQDVLTNNQANVALVSVDGGSGCVEPSEASVADGSYPIASPLTLLVNNSALARPDVQAFLWYAASDAQYGLLGDAGIVGLTFADFASLRQSLQDTFAQALLDAEQSAESPEATPEATDDETAAESMPEATAEATPEGE